MGRGCGRCCAAVGLQARLGSAKPCRARSAPLNLLCSPDRPPVRPELGNCAALVKPWYSVAESHRVSRVASYSVPWAAGAGFALTPTQTVASRDSWRLDPSLALALTLIGAGHDAPEAGLGGGSPGRGGVRLNLGSGQAAQHTTGPIHPAALSAGPPSPWCSHVQPQAQTTPLAALAVAPDPGPVPLCRDASLCARTLLRPWSVC